MAGGVAEDTKQRNISVLTARNVTGKRKKMEEGRNQWGRKWTRKLKSRPQVDRYPRSILAAWKPLTKDIVVAPGWSALPRTLYLYKIIIS